MLFPPERWLEGANISGGQKKLDKRGVLPKREPRSGSIYQPRVGASSANPRLEPNRLPTLKGLLYKPNCREWYCRNGHIIEMAKRIFLQPFQG